MKYCLCITLFLATTVAIAKARDTADDLKRYAVIVNRTPMQTWGPGSGVYLGHGLVLTAAHVVGRSFFTRPHVVVAGHELEAQTISEGSFEGTDLTLLLIDPSALPHRIRLRLNPICKQDPRSGQSVVSVMPSAITYSRILSPTALPQSARRFSTVIADVATTGNSGSGVYDAAQKCLLGIISRKISQTITSTAGKKETRDIAKYFVPASEIAKFIPAKYRYW